MIKRLLLALAILLSGGFFAYAQGPQNPGFVLLGNVVAGHCIVIITQFTGQDGGSGCGSGGGSGTNLGTGPLLEILPNDSGTGTAAGKIVKLTSAAQVRTILTSDTQDGVGICFSGITGSSCGTTGTAAIAIAGQVPCVFDGGTTANDWVVASVTNAGECHDSGSSTPPTTVAIFGTVLNMNVGAGTYSVDLNPLGIATALNKKINAVACSAVSGAACLSANNAFSGTNTFTTQALGDSSTKAATTQFVANAVTASNPAVAVQAATTAAADTSGFTYNNGVGGIGATFTGSVNTAVTIDGYTFTAVGQRLLVKNDTQSPSGAFNGVYSLTQLQTSLLAPIFTRASDYNQPSDINNTGAIPVVNGTANATTEWVLTSQVNTVGTDPLTYIQFTLQPSTIVTSTTTVTANNCGQWTGVGKAQQDGGTNNQIGSIASNCNFPTNTTVGSVANAGQGIYLMSSFRDDGTLNGGDQCLIWQVSEDAKTWNTLAGNSVAYTDPNTSGAGCGMRDFSFIRFNGKYWITYDYDGTNFGVASSSNLQSGWSWVAAVSVSALPGVSFGTAPEWLHNADGSPYLVNGLPAIIATVANASFNNGQPALLTPTSAAMTSWNAATLIPWPGNLTGGTAAEVSTTATLTFSGGQTFVVGQHINVSGCSVSGYNGTALVLTGVTGTTLSYTAGSGLGTATGCVAAVDAIDFYGVNDGGTFYLFGKDDASGDKQIWEVSGPAYNNYTTTVSWQAVGTIGAQDIEGPSVIKLATGSYEIMVDKRTDAGLQYSTSSSITGPWSAITPMTMAAQYYNHGTIGRILDANTQRNILGAFAGYMPPVYATLQMTNCTIPNNSVTEIPWATNACTGSTGTFTKLEDTDGFYNSGNNTRLTAPSAGRYNVCADAQWTANATGTRTLQIDLMDVPISTTFTFGKNQMNGEASSGPDQTTCWDVTMNKGDYVQATVFQNSGGNLALTGAHIEITRPGAY